VDDGSCRARSIDVTEAAGEGARIAKTLGIDAGEVAGRNIEVPKKNVGDANCGDGLAG
jgi:hypothetical protein